MTALEEVTERFHKALAEQGRTEDVLNKAASAYGTAKKEAKAAADLVTKLGEALNILTELEPKEGVTDDEQS